MAADFHQKLDLQIRADDRSARALRSQYRVRFHPSVRFNNAWSLRAFAGTGDRFGASHNSIDDGQADHFYLRRAYVRHEGTYGKTEIGVIPPFKGRVSSSGLSKDGWIRGIRYVRQLSSGAQLEAVVGQIDSADAAKALGLPSAIDYLEMEYSAEFSDRTSYEVGLERMTGGNFFRTELRHKFGERYTGFAEVVYRLDDSGARAIAGVASQLKLFGNATKLEANYGYVDGNFGLRAELSEDFFGIGHGFQVKIASNFGSSRWGWFARIDRVESRSRLLAGVKWSL